MSKNYNVIFAHFNFSFQKKGDVTFGDDNDGNTVGDENDNDNDIRKNGVKKLGDVVMLGDGISSSKNASNQRWQNYSCLAKGAIPFD